MSVYLSEPFVVLFRILRYLSTVATLFMSTRNRIFSSIDLRALGRFHKFQLRLHNRLDDVRLCQASELWSKGDFLKW